MAMRGGETSQILGTRPVEFPDSIEAELIRAPAEFAVPVKQDRRLKPPFALRVTLKFSRAVNVPIVITAHAVTDSEFGNLEAWLPPQVLAAETCEMVDRPSATELKGTIQFDHVFLYEPHPSAPPHHQALEQSAVGAPEEWPWAADAAEAPDGARTVRAGSDAQSAEGAACQARQPSWDSTLQALSQLVKDPTGSFEHASVKREADADMLPPIEVPQESMETGLEGSPGPFATEHLPSGASPPGDRASERSVPTSASPPQQHEQTVVCQDFEFQKLEFARPSRMSKVYIVFSLQISCRDLIFVTFDVPTICFCRREQKERAYSKLGVPYRRSSESRAPVAAAAGGVHDGSRDANGLSREIRRSAIAEPPHKRGRPLATLVPPGVNSGTALTPQMIAATGPGPHMGRQGGRGGGGAADADFKPQHAAQHAQRGGVGPREGIIVTVTAQQAKEYVESQYGALGTARPLQAEDIEALLTIAGFLPGARQQPASHRISASAFEEFLRGWAAICGLLRTIGAEWASRGPQLICGFAVDHAAAMAVLCACPVGAFLCRFSLSQPGNLVVVCKAPGERADAEGMLHALLTTADLSERSLGGWVLTFESATHLVDTSSPGSSLVPKHAAFPQAAAAAAGTAGAAARGTIASWSGASESDNHTQEGAQVAAV